jgi:PIN domain nuclease of toxin-antitoxin system
LKNSIKICTNNSIGSWGVEKIIQWEIKTSIQYEHEKLKKNQYGDVRNWNHKSNLGINLISIWNQHACKTKKSKIHILHKT